MPRPVAAAPFAAAFLSATLLALAPGGQGPIAPPDLDTIRKQPDLQKRYTAALNFAASRIDAARKSIEAGEREAFVAELKQFLAAVEFTDETLRATGKDPSRDSRHFKKAELRMNEFRRRLRSLESEVGVDERSPVSDTLRRLTELHDQLLQDIMGRRR